MSKQSSMSLPLSIKTDAVLVLEGLDGTGKTTQTERLERACMGMGQDGKPLFVPEPRFAHMPSAGTHIGHAIYDLTETVGEDLDPLARQFLHLASHAQSVRKFIRPTLRAEEPRPVVLDRWWWSTVAYGFFGGKLSRRGWDVDQFINMCLTTWRGVNADMIFLFMEPHVEDHHNTEDVIEGYQYLADRFPQRVTLIERGDEANQKEQMFNAMVRRGIYNWRDE